MLTTSLIFLSKVISNPPLSRVNILNRSSSSPVQNTLKPLIFVPPETALLYHKVCAKLGIPANDQRKNGESGRRSDLVRIFRRLAVMNKALDASGRAEMFNRVIPSILEADYGNPITSVSQIDNYNGGYIPDKLRERMEEIIKTGTLQELNKLYADPIWEDISNIIKLPYFGISAVIRLQKLYGIRTVQDLKKSNVDEIVLTAKQALIVPHCKQLVSPIPFAECKQHEDLIRNVAKKTLQTDIQVACVEEYRRGLPYNKQMKVLVSLPTSVYGYSSNMTPVKPLPEENERLLEVLLKGLFEENYLLELLQHNENSTEIAALCKIPSDRYSTEGINTNGAQKLSTESIVRLLRLTYVKDPREFPTNLFIATGSRPHVTRMRFHALRQGMWLSQAGLFKIPVKKELFTCVDIKEVSALFGSRLTEDRISVKDEEHLYQLLGVPYLRPDLRWM